MNSRSGPAGARRTTLGPSRPPRKNPTPIGTAADQSTGPATTNHSAATALAAKSSTFLRAISGQRLAVVWVSTASIITPAAAPK